MAAIALMLAVDSDSEDDFDFKINIYRTVMCLTARFKLNAFKSHTLGHVA